MMRRLLRPPGFGPISPKLLEREGSASGGDKEPGARRVRAASSTQRMEPAIKRAKTTSSPQSVAFIACGEERQDFTTSFRRRALLRAARNALDAGAAIINIAFHRTVSGDLVDTETMLSKLQSEFDAMWIFGSIGSVMSFFSDSCGTLVSEDVLDPEGFPALMLTFNTAEGSLCIVTTSMPSTPSRARERMLNEMLNEYVDAATSTEAECILISGVLQGNVVFIENQVAQLKLQFQLRSNEDLYVLAHNPDSRPVRYFALDPLGPYSILGMPDSSRSVEQPAPCVRDVRPSARHPGHRSTAAAHQGIRLTPPTPLYNKFIAELEPAVQNHPSGETFMNYIATCCFHGKLLLLNQYGELSKNTDPTFPKDGKVFYESQNGSETCTGKG